MCLISVIASSLLPLHVLIACSTKVAVFVNKTFVNNYVSNQRNCIIFATAARINSLLNQVVYLYEESLLIRDQISSLLLSVSPILLWNSYVPQSPLILFRHCHCLSHFQIHPTGKVQFGFIVLMFSMRRLIPLKRS